MKWGDQIKYGCHNVHLKKYIYFSFSSFDSRLLKNDNDIGHITKRSD